MRSFEYHIINFPPLSIIKSLTKSNQIELMNSDPLPYVRSAAAHKLIFEAELIQEAIEHFVTICKDQDSKVQRLHLIPLCMFLCPKTRWGMSSSVKVNWWNQLFTEQLKDKILSKLIGRIDPINLPFELFILGQSGDDSIIEFDWMSIPQLSEGIKMRYFINSLVALGTTNAISKLNEIASADPSLQLRIAYELISLGQKYDQDKLQRLEKEHSTSDETRYLFATASMGCESSIHQVREIINREDFAIWNRMVVKFYFRELKDLPFECEVIRKRMNLILEGNPPSSQ